ncbi:MAG: hypothetical protein V1746_04585 [bacterium]
MKDNYAQRQNVRDTEYQREYERWIESLSPAERAKLEADGLHEPSITSKTSNVSDKDVAESSLASETPDIAAIVDRESSNQESAATTADALASFCARLRSSKNPLLVFDAVCFATGVLALEGASQTELAKRHGVSKAAFSKIAVQWSKTFGLKPSRGMKSKKARKKYRLVQLTRYHRHGENGRN